MKIRIKDQKHKSRYFLKLILNDEKRIYKFTNEIFN